MNCAVILARGGSKGCPDKNKRYLHGVTLVGRAIRTAKRSGVCDGVVVATDDRDIWRIAKNEGAVVAERKPASDFQTSEDGLLECKFYWKGFDNIALIQCTSPFMMPEDIKKSYYSMITAKAQSCCTVSPFHGIVWSGEPMGGREPRQLRAVEYKEAGSVYWMNTRSFLQYRTRFCGKTVMYEIPEERSMEIDSEFDFIQAQCLIDNVKELDSELYC